MWKYITLTGAFFLSILYMPWWITILLGIVLLSFFKGYEVVAGGVVLDLLYGTPSDDIAGMSYTFTLIFFILFIAGLVIKRRILFYRQ